MNNEKKIITFAKYIITNYGVSTPLKLQKLLFFVRKEEILTKQSLASEVFDDNFNFEAWMRGPVSRDVYHYFRPFFQNVDEDEDYITNDEFPNYDEFIEKYVEFDGFSLTKLSHKERSWLVAREKSHAKFNMPSQEKMDENIILSDVTVN